MRGFEILEKSNLKPHKLDGIEPYEVKIGFLDFLRDIRNGADAIPRMSSFMVVGIHEVLYMMNQEERFALEREIHSILQAAAVTLDRKLVQVQIVCEGKLVKGDSLYLEYRGEKLPIDLIFGTTNTNSVRGIIPVYSTGFNLST